MKNYRQSIKRSGLKEWSYLFAGIGLLMCTSPIQAATVLVNPIADTMLISTGTSGTETYTNYGASALLGGSIYGTDGTGEYSLLRFNLSTLPAGAILESVTLKLTATFDYSYANGEALHIWQVASGNSGWVQGSSTGTGATAAYLNQTSYIDPTDNGGASWISGGIFNAAPGDLGAEIGFASLGGGVVADTTYSFNLNAAALSNWLIDGNLQNAGLAFHMTNDGVFGSRFLYFNSMNSGASAALLPQLEITYSIPEPSTTILMSIAAMYGLIAIKRRRAA